MQYCILTVILVVQHKQAFGNPTGRSGSAVTDICLRFPHLNGCNRQNDLPQSINQQQHPVKITPTHDLAHLGYCGKYRAHFQFYCNSTREDSVIKFFCQAYRSKCSGRKTDRAAATVNPPAASDVEDDTEPPSWEEIVDYCHKNKWAYSKLCVGNYIRSEATKFCTAYNSICPGAPHSLPAADEALPSSATKASENSDQQLVTWNQITSYCKEHKASYWKMCMNMNNPIRPETREFCIGYNNICPGAADPRLSYIPSSPPSGSVAQISPQRKENVQNVKWQQISPQTSRSPPPAPLNWERISSQPSSSLSSAPLNWEQISSQSIRSSPSTPLNWQQINSQPSRSLPPTPLNWQQISSQPSGSPPATPLNWPQSSPQTVIPPVPGAAPASKQKASSANSGNFPWNDDTLTDMMMMPGGLEGFSGMNSLQIPFFGNPQQGGFDLAQTFMAPLMSPFGINKGANVNPMKSATIGEGVSIAGIKAGGYSNVDWSGTPGLNGLSGIPGLGKKKKK